MVDKKSRVKDAVTREYTINLHKRLHKITFKKRAPKAIKEIKKFASKHMRTSDVRVDVKLNKAVWSRGIRNVPTKLRIQISRKRNDDEDAKEDMYSYVTVADDQQFKGKNTEVVDA
ncbi:60S ribosomal protein L31 [Trebouxia sp. C0010 RCD-2024]